MVAQRGRGAMSFAAPSLCLFLTSPSQRLGKFQRCIGNPEALLRFGDLVGPLSKILPILSEILGLIKPQMAYSIICIGPEKPG